MSQNVRGPPMAIINGLWAAITNVMDKQIEAKVDTITGDTEVDTTIRRLYRILLTHDKRTDPDYMHGFVMGMRVLLYWPSPDIEALFPVVVDVNLYRTGFDAAFKVAIVLQHTMGKAWNQTINWPTAYMNNRSCTHVPTTP